MTSARPTVPLAAPSTDVVVPSVSPTSHTPTLSTGERAVTLPGAPCAPRRGKAPPVDKFDGDDVELPFEEWLPSFERASMWNSWTEEEKLIQLAGHLRGRALQEYNLLLPEDKSTFNQTIEALRARLEPGGRAVAAQDFRHSVQADAESVSDFIRRLERTFRTAFGRDTMSRETKDAILHGQLQEGLRLELLKAPAVSGATKYPELCVAARNEEKRLAEYERRLQYNRSQTQPSKGKQPTSSGPSTLPAKPPRVDRGPGHSLPGEVRSEGRRCYQCKKPGHIMKDCPQKKTESSRSSRDARTQQVSSEGTSSSTQSAIAPTPSEPLSLLFSESEEEDGVRQVTVNDSGSHCQLARVNISRVPADGVVDTAADITIMGGKLFALVAATARLKKRDFRKADRVPRMYDRKVFKLDGCMDMEVTFQEKTIKTTVYIKMDATDQLLLSEGVCRQLEIVTYHPTVQPKKPARGGSAVVPSVRVELVQSLRLPPSRSAVVEVQLEGLPSKDLDDPVMVEGDGDFERETGVTVENVLVSPSGGGKQLVITNLSGITQVIPEGVMVGEAHPVEVLEPSQDPDEGSVTQVKKLSSVREEWRKKELVELLNPLELPESDAASLQEFLISNHDVFSLEDGERGETDLVSMEIKTGDSLPCKQPLRRMPFVVRKEVAKQLKDMQRNNVIQPSSSPWSSPVVMVRKRDGSHRFCVDYRALNTVTKADTFPLPRIDDLLKCLGGARYFSTLDLASGFWQIPMEATSREKTAFATPHGLFEFLVMPFGLTNAPAVFQRLMQRVLAGLNPDDGEQFVTAYLDDILVFSRTFQDHMEHLAKVINRLRDVNLKLKPPKCKFARREVEYLGHFITPGGLKPNVRLTSAVQDFPRPQNIHEVRRFLGMASYYRRFIPHFARIAQPLHHLTSKDVPFAWSSEAESAFTALKAKLVTPPVLAYPRFGEDFTLETDASIQGLGAVLSQKQEDGKLHPIAYASRALSKPERNYSVTELETLAVVWAITHFRSHLYGGRVTVLTDHSAVKAAQTPRGSMRDGGQKCMVLGSSQLTSPTVLGRRM